MNCGSSPWFYSKSHSFSRIFGRRGNSTCSRFLAIFQLFFDWISRDCKIIKGWWSYHNSSIFLEMIDRIFDFIIHMSHIHTIPVVFQVNNGITIFSNESNRFDHFTDFRKIVYLPRKTSSGILYLENQRIRRKISFHEIWDSGICIVWKIKTMRFDSLV